MQHIKKNKVQRKLNCKENPVDEWQSQNGGLKRNKPDNITAVKKRKFGTVATPTAAKRHRVSKSTKIRLSKAECLKKEVDDLQKDNYKDFQRLARSKRIQGGFTLEIKTLNAVILSLIADREKKVLTQENTKNNLHKANLWEVEKDKTLHVGTCRDDDSKKKELIEARMCIEALRLETSKLRLKINEIRNDKSRLQAPTVIEEEVVTQQWSKLNNGSKRANIAERKLENLLACCTPSSKEQTQLKTKNRENIWTPEINRESTIKHCAVYLDDVRKVDLTRHEKVVSVAFSGEEIQSTVNKNSDDTESLENRKFVLEKVTWHSIQPDSKEEQEAEDKKSAKSVVNEKIKTKRVIPLHHSELALEDTEAKDLNITSDSLINISYTDRVNSFEVQVAVVNISVASVNNEIQKKIKRACEAQLTLVKMSEERNKMAKELENLRERMSKLQTEHNTVLFQSSMYQTQIEEMSVKLNLVNQDAGEVEDLRARVADLVQAIGGTKKSAEELGENVQFADNMLKEKVELFELKRNLETELNEVESEKMSLKDRMKKETSEVHDITDLWGKLEVMLTENTNLKQKFAELKGVAGELCKSDPISTYILTEEADNSKIKEIDQNLENSFCSVETSTSRINLPEINVKTFSADLEEMTKSVFETKEKLARVTQEKNKYAAEVKDLQGKLEATDFQSSTYQKHLHETISMLEAVKQKAASSGKFHQEVIELNEKLKNSNKATNEFRKKAETAEKILGEFKEKYSDDWIKFQEKIEGETDKLLEKLQIESNLEVAKSTLDKARITEADLNQKNLNRSGIADTKVSVEEVDSEVSGLLNLTMEAMQKLALVKAELSRDIQAAVGETWVSAKEWISELEQMLSHQATRIPILMSIFNTRKCNEKSEVAVQVKIISADQTTGTLPRKCTGVFDPDTSIYSCIETPAKARDDILTEMTPKTFEISKLSEKLERAVKGKMKVAQRATDMIINLENANKGLKEEIEDLQRL